MMGAMNAYRNYGIRYAGDGVSVKPSTQSLVNMNFGAARISSVSVSGSSISSIAQATAAAVCEGAFAGISSGMNAASSQAERRRRLRKRTGL